MRRGSNERCRPWRPLEAPSSSLVPAARERPDDGPGRRARVRFERAEIDGLGHIEHAIDEHRAALDRDLLRIPHSRLVRTRCTAGDVTAFLRAVEPLTRVLK